MALQSWEWGNPEDVAARREAHEQRQAAACAACHHLIGSTGKLGRDERRRLEAEYGARTRAAVQAAGQWPKKLPAWKETP